MYSRAAPAGVQDAWVGFASRPRGLGGGLLDCGMARGKDGECAEMRREEDETRQDFSQSSRGKGNGP